MFTGFVWESDGRVVGNVTVNRTAGRLHRWQISNVAVLDVYRGQGIGQKLVRAALDLIAERRGQTAYLYVRQDNLPALKLYEGLGFVEVDRRSELELQPMSRRRGGEPCRLRSLRSSQQQDFFDLVRRAEGPGYHWLNRIQRREYVLSADERMFKWLESLLSGRIESRWVVSDERQLCAGTIIRAARRWKRASHQLQLWIHPNWRGQLEEMIVDDIFALLSRHPARATRVCLPACEDHAIAALRQSGFCQIRTLVLMRVDV
jgi:RimJ/RimL family protein N-acetyltransferase